MLRLTLWNNAETEQHSVEIYEHMPVNLTYQFSDTSEINKAVGGYSQTFRIPATKVNTDFFGAIYDANIFTDSSGLIKSNYSVKRKIRAELSYNSLPLMKGFVQIKAVYLQKKDFADIELVFLSDAVDLATSIGDSMLSDLDTTSINHELNKANVESSWIGFLKSGNVTYGMIDKGRNWSFADENFLAWSSTDGIYHGDLTPYVKAKWMLDRIMSEAGYTYDSALFDTADFDNVFLPAFNGAITPVSDDTAPEAQKAASGLAADFTLTTSYVLAPMVDSVSGAYDYSSNWTNSPTYIFTAPYTCHIDVSVNLWLVAGSAKPQAVIRKNGTTDLAEFFNGGTHTTSITLQTGDTIALYVKKYGVGSGDLNSGAINQSDTTWLRIDSVSEALTGQDVVMSLNFPEVKQIDFLMTLQKMYNLVFILDKYTPKHLLIEPFNDYTSSGVSKDWTNKIDYTKDVVIKPTTDIQSKEYDWTYTEGGDFINDLIQKSAKRVYGRYKVTDSENDFATGGNETKASLSPYIMSYIPASIFPIYRAIDKDGNGVKKPKMKLAYWNSLRSFGSWYLRDDAGVTQSYSSFPHFSNYNSELPTVTDNDLNFGYEPAFIVTEAHPLHTQFYRFWMDYVNELYSPEARLFTAYFKLTRAEIQSFEFNDKIYLKDSYYRILKISNYDATTGGSVKIELLKV